MKESTATVRNELTGTRRFYMSEDEMYSRLEEYIKGVRPDATKEDGETRNDFVTRVMQELSKDINFWTENSMKHGMTDEEFILLTLAKCAIPNCDCISFSYALLNSDFSEDAIAAAMYITSKASSFDGWSVGNGDYFVDIIDKGLKYNAYYDVINFINDPHLNHGDPVCNALRVNCKNANEHFLEKRSKLKEKIKNETEILKNMQQDFDNLVSAPVEVSDEKKKLARSDEELAGLLLEAKAKRRDEIKLAETKIESAQHKIEKMQVKCTTMRPELILKDRLDWRAIKERQAVMSNPEFFKKHELLIKTVDEAIQKARQDELAKQQ